MPGWKLQKLAFGSSFLIALACTSPAPKVAKDAERPNTAHYYIVSLNNRANLFHAVKAQDAQKLKKQLGSPKKMTSEALQTRIILGRWGREPYAGLRQDAGNLVEFEMHKGVERDISETIKFDLMVAAYYAQEFADMMQFLEDLSTSKDKKVLALVANFRGVLAWQDGRIPEAGVLFEQALSLDPKNEGALLNLGFLNLKYGYGEQAEKYLSRVPEDTLAQSGRIVAAQLQGKSAAAGKLCDSFLKVVPKHKPTLFNCAQIAFYELKDASRAQSLLEKFTQVPGGENEWNQEGAKLLDSLKSVAKVSKVQK